jgi:hypothetical protein
MDYFSELLESYAKLKKRKFKLTYLTEAEDKKKKKEEKPEPKTDAATLQKAQQVADAAINDAPSIASAEIATNGLKVNNVLGEPTGLIIYRNINNGSVGVQGLGPQGGILSIDKYDTKTKTVNRVPDAYDKFVEKLAGESELTNTSKTSLEQDQEQQEQEELLAQQAEMERLAKLEQLGGAFELAGRNPEDLKVILNNLTRSEKSLREFCSNLGDKIEGSLKNLCGRPGAYIAGASKSGFEYKLSQGQAITVDPETGKRVGVGPLEIGLLQAVTESHAALTNFLTGEGDCETITSKVGFYKNRLVLFGDSPTEGVTIEPNALQFASVDRLKQDCGDPDLTEVISDTLSLNEINAVKGTFNELTLQTGVRLLAAKTNKERKAAFKEIAEEIGRRRKFLTAYAATQENKDDVALGLDESFNNDILLEQAGIAQDNVALRDWFLNEMAMQLNFVRAVKADSVVPAGKEGGTGDRADTKLLYLDKTKAEAAAKLIGSSVQKRKDGEGYEVGVGQKRLKLLKGVKIGEINDTSRMTEIFDESVDSDQNLVAGFIGKIRDMQFAGNEGRYDAAQSFYEGIEKKIEKSTRSLTDYATYLDANGKIKSIKPEARLKTIADSVKGLLGYDALKNSALGKALFRGDSKYRDFEDTSTQQRASEIVQREARFKAIKDAIDNPNNPDNQAARDTLIRMTLICGANKESMSQLITEDSGESYVVAHNEALERICKANVDGKLDINIEGTTATMTTTDGISVSFSQEGTWGGGKRHNRSVTKLSKTTIEKLNLQIDTQEESTFYQFLQGQMNLLENILNQTKHTQSL